MAFGQVFQRVGQFPGHASQRTMGRVGPLCALLTRFSPVHCSSPPAPNKVSPLFGPSSSSALKGSRERHGAYISKAMTGRQVVVDTPLLIVSCIPARLTPPWKGTGCWALSYPEYHGKECRFHEPMGIHLAVKKHKTKHTKTEGEGGDYYPVDGAFVVC